MNHEINGDQKESTVQSEKEQTDSEDATKSNEGRATHHSKIAGKADEGWYESIEIGKLHLFLVHDGSQFNYLTKVHSGDQTFIPKVVQSHQPYSLKLGERPRPIPSLDELLKRIREEFAAFVDIDDKWRDLFAACVLLSYQQEKMTTVPYLLLVGDNGTGKTTVLDLFNELGYRPLFSVDVSSANIYGYLAESEEFVPMILEDELQGIEYEYEKVKIYKSGYKKGARVPRTDISNGERTQSYFSTFCFKVFASESIPEGIRTRGLRQRFIEVHMSKGDPARDWMERTQDDIERLRQLRNDLLRFRLLTRSADLPQLLGLNLKGRMKEIWRPVLQVVSGLPVYDRLFSLSMEQTVAKLEELRQSDEGHLIKVISEAMPCYLNGTTSTVTIDSPTLWELIAREFNGYIEERRPSVIVTQDGDRSKRHLSDILQSKLSARKGEIGTGNDRQRCYTFDTKIITRMAKEYGFGTVGTDETVFGSELEPRESGIHQLSEEERDQNMAPTEDTTPVTSVPSVSSVPR